LSHRSSVLKVVNYILTSTPIHLISSERSVSLPKLPESHYASLHASAIPSFFQSRPTCLPRIPLPSAPEPPTPHVLSSLERKFQGGFERRKLPVLFPSQNNVSIPPPPPKKIVFQGLTHRAVTVTIVRIHLMDRTYTSST
jgi:hypothetical protein